MGFDTIHSFRRALGCWRVSPEEKGGAAVLQIKLLGTFGDKSLCEHKFLFLLCRDKITGSYGR